MLIRRIWPKSSFIQKKKKCPALQAHQLTDKYGKMALDRAKILLEQTNLENLPKLRSRLFKRYSSTMIPNMIRMML